MQIKLTLNPFLVILLLIFNLSLIGCETTPSPDNDEDEDEDEDSLTSVLSVSCDELICRVNTAESYVLSPNIVTHTCNMGDDTIVDIFTLEPTFDYTFSTPNTYFISCTITDSEGENDTDSVTVTVGGLSVDAGPDQNVSAGEQVFLDGTGSTASSSSGPGLTYFWTKWSSVTNPITLDDRTAASPSFIAPSENFNQTIKFSLTVSEGSNSTSPDYVEIFVAAAVVGGATD